MLAETEGMNLDSMYGQNHDVYHEFPEHKERIDNLKKIDLNFAKLVDEYTNLNRQVIRIEQCVEPRDHFFLEELKKKRLVHKDRLYAFLQL
ncbi:MAG: YdcH family protein [Gammaproteobacteria bacterium]|nr:YdcH family protein [Gammaproteobacteria bacterium]MDH3768258.1 YdcH family protein [Gammaproteobacteria bacterium]